MRCALALLLVGCMSPAEEGLYRDPTSLGDATTAGGITARLVAPRIADTQREPLAKLVLEAFTPDSSSLQVTAQDVEGTTYAATVLGEPGPSQRFELDVPLLHGDNPLRVAIREPFGTRSRILDVNLVYAGAAPGVRFTLAPVSADGCRSPFRADVTSEDQVCVRGRVSAGDDAIARVTVAIDASAVDATLNSGAFVQPRDVAFEGARDVVVSVADAGGLTTRVTRRLVRDVTPPRLEVPSASGPPQRTESNRAVISGRVSDASGIAGVSIVNEAGGEVEPRIEENGSFDWPVQLEPGSNAFEVVARDAAGNVAQVSVNIVRERLIRLGVAESGGATQLRLDRAALQEILTEDAQRSLEVVTISLRTAVIEALTAIREPERFGLDTTEWGPAEFNLANILRMTPDTVDLSGSSLEDLLTIAPLVGLPSPRLLAQLLDIEPTETFLSLERVADGILEGLIATHPEVVRGPDGDPALRLTMFDVLQNLAPVAPRFGPTGEHPGFLRGESRSAVLEPGFLLTVPVESNIDVRDGVDASRGGKDFLFLLDDDSAISIDFLSDASSIVGLVDEPVVDLQFVVGEDGRFLGPGAVREARPDSERAGFFRGAGESFAAARWAFEHIIAESAYLQYSQKFEPGYSNLLRYDAGSIEDAAVLDWDRGWVIITTSGGLGNPPNPAYAWDVLSEVAQLRLHEGGVPEGEADLAFRLEALPIGIDADGLVERLRPTLQAQEAALAARIINRESIVESGVDFFFETALERGLIYFVAPSDINGPYGYDKPGFFAEASLTTETSTLAGLGTTDTVHHKLIPVAGDSHFFADDEGVVYRLDVVNVSSRQIEVRVVPDGGGS